MARPRTHDLEELMNVAETLAVESGGAAVTVRALSDLTSVSNGAIYHAFGSRAGLVGGVWLRAARRLLAAQSEAVSAILDSPNPYAVDGVVAAADAPARFLLEHATSGQFLLTVSRSELLGSRELPEQLTADLNELDSTLTDLFVRLSRAMWGRADRQSVDVIRDCVVELPTALLLRGRRTPDEAARARLSAAVRGVLAIDLPLTDSDK